MSEETIKPKHHKKRKDKSDKTKSKKRRRESLGDSVLKEKSLKSKRTNDPATTSHITPDLNSTTDTPFHLQTLSLYITLSPISQLHPLLGICAEHLSPLILTYLPALQGVVLSYSNPRLSENPGHSSNDKTKKPLAKSVDEYAVSFIWVTAEFLVFRPRRNTWIEGWVNLQNEGHIGLVCWNLFNGSIERKRLPRGWKWKGVAKGTTNGKLKGAQADASQGTDGGGGMSSAKGNVQHEEGYFEDEQGMKITGAVRFRVTDVETSANTDREKGFLSIEGTMLSEAEEQSIEAGFTTTQRRRKKGDTINTTRGNGLERGISKAPRS